MHQDASIPKLDKPTYPTLTTINYALEWPHLENPSNTTFAGLAQIDMCQCPHASPSPPNEQLGDRWPEEQAKEDPRHFYTRYKCSEPEVRFKSVEEPLWVLQRPYGPINMLQPASADDRKRRADIHEGAEPAAYAGKNIFLLTGPCPRGRYQAFATLQYLKSLSSEARSNLQYISLLVQRYEEDCSDGSVEKSYSELAEYILHNLPDFKALHLNIWDDEKRLRNAASTFGILLHKQDVEIVVGWTWCGGHAERYNSARAFLEAMNTKKRKGNRPGHTSPSAKKCLPKKDEQSKESNDSHDWEDEEGEEKEVVRLRDPKHLKGALEAAQKALFDRVVNTQVEKRETVPVKMGRPSLQITQDAYESSGRIQRRGAYRTPAKINLFGNNGQQLNIAQERENRPTEQEQELQQEVHKEKEGSKSPSEVAEEDSDEEWFDVESSPTSQNGAEEESWQML